MTHYVYRYYDSADRLLYIGSTYSFSTRAAAHERDATWWPDVTAVKLERFPDQLSSLSAEIYGIKTEGPIHNKAHVVAYEPPPAPHVGKMSWEVEKRQIRKRLRAEGRL